MKADAIAVVEAAYDLELGERAWMKAIVERAIPVVPEATRGVAYEMDLAVPSDPKFGMPVAVGFRPGFERDLLRVVEAQPVLQLDGFRRKVATLTEALGTREIGVTAMGEFVLASGAPDVFACFALDAEARGLHISTDRPRVFPLGRMARARWKLLGAHLAAAHRLRKRRSGDGDDCILEPGGRVLQAEDAAKSRESRETLREAVVARDRARTRAVRADPEEALAMWPGLVSGRWSLVDRFEHDGRRYVVARRNEPRPAGPLALSLRERQVLGHMVQGDSVKLTAYALGLSPSSVSGWHPPYD